jgi:hypothetical protein
VEDSVSTYLGKLDPSDLERMADELEELAEHPGMDRLRALLEMQKSKILYQLVHRPARDAVVPAHAGGVVKGLEMFDELIVKVQNKRAGLRQAALAESGERR